MKTKTTLAVALVALFVAMASAAPKGHSPAGLPVTIGCVENGDNVTDTCIVSFTSLDPGTTYNVVIGDPCGGNLTTTQLSGSSTHTFTFDFVSDCGTGLTISLSTGTGRKTTAVPVTVTGDTGSV